MPCSINARLLQRNYHDEYEGDERTSGTDLVVESTIAIDEEYSSDENPRRHWYDPK